MTPHPHTSGNQYLHRTDQAYRDGVRRKLTAYHRYVQLGCIAQGLLQYLALTCAVKGGAIPVGERPTRRLSLQPEAIGAVMEATKWLKPLV